MFAVVRLAIRSRSSISTAMCRLRPTAFQPPSNPRLSGDGAFDRLAVDHRCARTEPPALDARDRASFRCRGLSGTKTCEPIPGASHKLTAILRNESAASASHSPKEQGSAQRLSPLGNPPRVDGPGAPTSAPRTRPIPHRSDH